MSGPACDQGFREVPWTEEVRVRRRAGDTIIQSEDIELVNGLARATEPLDKRQDLSTSDGVVRSSTSVFHSQLNRPYPCLVIAAEDP